MEYSRTKRSVPKVLLAFSLGCTCFTYGLVAGRYKLFPYSVLRNARTALIGVGRLPGDSGLAYYKKHVLVPTVMRLDPASGEVLLLLRGGKGYLKDHNEDGCLAWLMDRSGTVLHTWKYAPSLRSHLQRATRAPGVPPEPYPVGLHLYDDGGLLVTFHHPNEGQPINTAMYIDPPPFFSSRERP